MARKLAKRLGACIALVKDQSLIPNANVVHNLVTPIQGLRHPLMTSEGTRHACDTETYIQAKHSYTQDSK